MTQREMIIDTAAEMFAKQGIKAVRMDDIARTLGISKRTIYEIFADKEELLYLGINRYLSLQEERFEALCRSGRNILEGMLFVFDYVAASTETSMRMRNSLQRFYPRIYERIVTEQHKREMKGELVRSLQRGVEAGLFSEKINLEWASIQLRYLLTGLIERHDIMALPEGMSIREAFTLVVVTFFRGIATVDGLRYIDEYLSSREGTESGSGRAPDTVPPGDAGIRNERKRQ